MHQIICEHALRPEFGDRDERQSASRPGQASGVPEEHHLDIVLAEHIAIIGGLKRGMPMRAAAMKIHLNACSKPSSFTVAAFGVFAPNSRAILDEFQKLYES